MKRLKGKKWAIKNGLNSEPRTPDMFPIPGSLGCVVFSLFSDKGD